MTLGKTRQRTFQSFTEGFCVCGLKVTLVQRQHARDEIYLGDIGSNPIGHTINKQRAFHPLSEGLCGSRPKADRIRHPDCKSGLNTGAGSSPVVYTMGQ